MCGYDAKIFFVDGVTIILNTVGWRMYVLLGDKVYIYDGWADESTVESDALPFDNRPERDFISFIVTTPVEKLVEHMGIAMTLYRSEEEIRQAVACAISKFQKRFVSKQGKKESA